MPEGTRWMDRVLLPRPRRLLSSRDMPITLVCRDIGSMYLCSAKGSESETRLTRAYAASALRGGIADMTGRRTGILLAVAGVPVPRR